MKLLDKILRLQKATSLNDNDFCDRYNINLSSFNKWKNEQSEIKKDDLSCLTDAFNLDLDDFINDNSTLDNSTLNEHLCKVKNKDEGLINEDFPKEGNPRYEERD